MCRYVDMSLSSRQEGPEECRHNIQSSWQTKGRKEETKYGACCIKYGRAPNLAVLDDEAVNVVLTYLIVLCAT